MNKAILAKWTSQKPSKYCADSVSTWTARINTRAVKALTDRQTTVITCTPAVHAQRVNKKTQPNCMHPHMQLSTILFFISNQNKSHSLYKVLQMSLPSVHHFVKLVENPNRWHTIMTSSTVEVYNNVLVHHQFVQHRHDITVGVMSVLLTII